MKFLTKKQEKEIGIRIGSLKEQIDYLKKQLNAKHRDNLRLSGELYSKTRYAEDYVKLYCEARKKNSELEDEVDLYKSKSETQSLVIDKLETDLYLATKEKNKMSKKLDVYDDKVQKAYNELVHRGNTKRLKKKKEKELYYALLNNQKK